MGKLNDKDMYKAFCIWKQSYPFRWIDEEAKDQENGSNRNNWLETARLAQMLTTDSVAKRLGIAKNVYWKFEKGEKLGTISLNSLRKAAEATNCELVYLLRPKNGVSFAQVIWDQVFPHALGHPWVKSRPAFLKPAALAAISKFMIEDPEFRRKKEWSSRKSVSGEK